MNYVYEYCIGNDNVTQSEIQELLEDILDEEYDTICEDNSPVGMLEFPFGCAHLKQCNERKLSPQQKYHPCSSNIWIWFSPNNTTPYEQKSQPCRSARHNGWSRISRWSLQETRIRTVVMMMMVTKKWWKFVAITIRMFRVQVEHRSPMRMDGRRLRRRGDNKSRECEN